MQRNSTRITPCQILFTTIMAHLRFTIMTVSPTMFKSTWRIKESSRCILEVRITPGVARRGRQLTKRHGGTEHLIQQILCDGGGLQMCLQLLPLLLQGRLGFEQTILVRGHATLQYAYTLLAQYQIRLDVYVCVCAMGGGAWTSSPRSTNLTVNTTERLNYSLQLP